MIRAMMLWALVLLSSIPPLAAMPMRLPSLDDDTTCSVGESGWFHAGLDGNFDAAMRYVQTWQGVRHAHVLDAFGFSEGMAREWKKAGYRALVYDIKTDASMDIVTEAGFYKFLDLGMQLCVGALLVAGPPCSMYVGASASVHRRAAWRLLGDLTNGKVRLANLIWSNFAHACELLIKADRGLYFTIEQPAQSWGLKQACILNIKAMAGMLVTLTWLAFYGADLQKPTHLLSNMKSVVMLKRTMHKADREKFNARLKKRNARRKVPRVYYQEILKLDGSKGWQGGKDLPSSASYPCYFCKAMLRAWLEQMKRDSYKA